MARKPTEFDLLVQRGLIKVDPSQRKTIVNQTAQNQLVKDNKKGQNLTTEIQELSNNSYIQYTHNTEPINSIDLTAGSFSEYLSSTKFTSKIWPKLDLDLLKKESERVFYEEVIKKSEIRELETTQHFLKLDKNLINVNSKKEVLDFFNGTISNPREFDLNRVSTIFASKLSGKTQSENENLNSDLNSFVSKRDFTEKQLLQEMRNGVVDATSFIGFVQVLSQSNIIPNPKQAQQGGKTVLEFIEKINLEKMAAKALVGRNFKVKNVGSSPISQNIGLELQKSIEKNGYISDVDIQNAIDKSITPEELLKNHIMKNGSKRSGVDFAQTFMSASGSNQEVKVADLLFELDSREIYIDAKLSKEKGGRYTPSTGINSSINQILNTSLSGVITNEFIKNLNLAMSFILFLSYSGGLREEVFRSDQLKRLLTYGLLGSKEFLKKLRSNIDGSNENFKQPDFLLTSSGYIWYSDFFKIVSDIYFKQEQGYLASINFKDTEPFQNLVNPLLDLKVRAQNFEDFQTILKENNLNNLSKYVNTFINAKVNLKIDIKDLMSKLKGLNK